MPAHLSYLLQPLDMDCFSPLKRLYSTQVKGQMRLGINHIIKEDFLSVYYIAHTQAITEKNILSSFLATGLIPFNPDCILSTLGPVIRTPSPILTESIWESKIPHTIADIKYQASHIQQ